MPKQQPKIGDIVDGYLIVPSWVRDLIREVIDAKIISDAAAIAGKNWRSKRTSQTNSAADPNDK